MHECYRQLRDIDVYQEVAEAAFDADEIKAKALKCVTSMASFGLKQMRRSGSSMQFKGALVCLSSISFQSCIRIR